MTKTNDGKAADPVPVIDCIKHRLVTRFQGWGKNMFGASRFLFYYMSNQKYSGHNKIWGHKNLWRHCSRMSLILRAWWNTRLLWACRPARHQNWPLSVFRWSKQEILCKCSWSNAQSCRQGFYKLLHQNKFDMQWNDEFISGNLRKASLMMIASPTLMESLRDHPVFHLLLIRGLSHTQT